jgi:hypothetical protein
MRGRKASAELELLNVVEHINWRALISVKAFSANCFRSTKTMQFLSRFYRVSCFGFFLQRVWMTRRETIAVLCKVEKLDVLVKLVKRRVKVF